MRIPTLEYNANQPIAKQISVPMNSDYAVAVKVKKDGEFRPVGKDEMTLNGQTATSQYDGYNIYELKSGSVPTTRNYALDIQAKPTVDTILTNSGSAESKPNSSGYYLDIKSSIFSSTKMSLSEYDLPETITFTLDKNERTNLSRYRIVKESGTGEWQPYEKVVFEFKDIVDGREVSYSILHDDDGIWHWYMTYNYTDYYVGDTLTINTSTAYFLAMTTRVRLQDTEPFSIEAELRLALNTNDGFTDRYDFLRVQEKDLGYIEF